MVDRQIFRRVQFNPADFCHWSLAIRQLYLADVIFKTDPTREPEAIQSIKSILDKVQQYEPQGSDWSPAYYADLAVKASLRLGNTEQAKAILLRGLQLEPDSEELGYLSRILIREGILQPGEIPPLARSGGKPTLVN